MFKQACRCKAHKNRGDQVSVAIAARRSAGEALNQCVQSTLEFPHIDGHGNHEEYSENSGIYTSDETIQEHGISTHLKRYFTLLQANNAIVKIAPGKLIAVIIIRICVYPNFCFRARPSVLLTTAGCRWSINSLGQPIPSPCSPGSDSGPHRVFRYHSLDLRLFHDVSWPPALL